MSRRVVRPGVAMLALLVANVPGMAQYWGERVLEKSFEQTEFFFVPHNLLPYGIGTFKTVAPGLIDEPLLNAAVNPAYLSEADLERAYVYLDFRNTHLVQQQQGYVWPGGYAETRTTVEMIPYPWFYVETRKAAEPVFSGAVLARPFGGGLSLGFTYQALLQDQAYYGIPQDIYRARLGVDYAGESAVRAEDIPIVDRYTGTDEMHEVGHFFGLLASCRLLPRLSLGAKVNRTTFNREGRFGSQGLWDQSQPVHQSVWRNWEERTQNYGHWETSGGFSCAVKKFEVGATAGYLWGDAVQFLTRSDSSLWHYRNTAHDDSSRYLQRAAVQQQWDHRGKTAYGALTVRADLSPTHRLTGYYLYLSQRIDMAPSSVARDTAFYAHRYTWNDDWYEGRGLWALRDARSGNGEGPLRLHRVAASLHWQLDQQMQLHIGVNYEHRHKSITTRETVSASLFRETWEQHSRTGQQHSYERIGELKTLHWDFDAREATLQIPVVFTWQPVRPMELLLGINRSMKRWEITDVTTAIFVFREITQDTVTWRRTNFGERYTEPRERRSEVQTTFLAGVTVRPSARLSARLLGVPHYVSTPTGMTLREMQWWLAITLNL